MHQLLDFELWKFVKKGPRRSKQTDPIKTLKQTCNLNAAFTRKSFLIFLEWPDTSLPRTPLPAPIAGRPLWVRLQNRNPVIIKNEWRFYLPSFVAGYTTTECVPHAPKCAISTRNRLLKANLTSKTENKATLYVDSIKQILSYQFCNFMWTSISYV